MDAEFTLNLYGQAEIKLSMGFEALADYLNTECSDSHSCQRLLRSLNQQQKRRFGEEVLNGQEYSLIMSDDEIQIRHNSHSQDDWHSDSFDEDLTPYDHESESHCGLSDLVTLVQGWQKFLEEVR